MFTRSFRCDNAASVWGWGRRSRRLCAVGVVAAGDFLPKINYKVSNGLGLYYRNECITINMWFGGGTLWFI